jgi:hypothetical protein
MPTTYPNDSIGQTLGEGEAFRATLPTSEVKGENSADFHIVSKS